MLCFQWLVELHILDLSHNALNFTFSANNDNAEPITVEGGWLPSLKELKLDNNPISELDSRAFLQLAGSDLASLRLKDTNLTKIGNGMYVQVNSRMLFNN